MAGGTPGALLCTPAVGSVPVLVLCGLPTSGHEAVVTSLYRFMSAEYEWMMVTDPMSKGHGAKASVTHPSALAL